MKRTIGFLTLLLASAVLAGEPVTVKLDAGKELGPVNKMVLGHNLEAGDGRGIFFPQSDKDFNRFGTAYGQGVWNPTEHKSNPLFTGILKKMHTGSLRYPGGCLNHNFDWRKAVGPVSERKGWEFGVNEYLTVCREIDAEPVITLSEFLLPSEEMPQHLAGFVEYLNAPAEPRYPLAMKRAADGYPEPWKVKYFEVGNESYHVNHETTPVRSFTPEQYVKFFNDSAAAIRKIDPTVKLGVVGGLESDAAWNRVVYAGTREHADFVVHHYYRPGFQMEATPETNLLIAAQFGDSLRDLIRETNEEIRHYYGKPLPLALTEYNTGALPPRFTQLSALSNATYQAICLEPENNVLMANFWQIFGGYFGPVRTNGMKVDELLAAYAGLEVAGEGVLDTRIGFESDSPLMETPQLGTQPARSKKVRGQSAQSVPTVKLQANSDMHFPPEIQLRGNNAGNGNFTIELDKATAKSECYPELYSFIRPTGMPKGEPAFFEVSFEARFLPASNNNGSIVLGFGLGDARGWDKTASAIAVEGIQAAQDWQEFKGQFTSLADAELFHLLFRARLITGDVSGKIEVRNLKVTVYNPPARPAFPAVYVLPTKSADGKMLNVLLFNREIKNNHQVNLKPVGFKAELVEKTLFSFPSDQALNEDYRKPEKSALTASDRVAVDLPPHSITLVSFRTR